MKKGMVYIIVILLSILFIGCKNSNNNTINNTSTNEKIECQDTGFGGMPNAEKTIETQPLNQMKKIYCNFVEGNATKFGEIIGMDIEKKELYINYYYTQLDDAEPTYKLSDNEIEEFLNIIETYKVQEWEQEYILKEYADSNNYYSWAVYMQNEDNTVEKHRGEANTSYSEKVKPPNYDEFRAAMIEFVDRCDIEFSRIPLSEIVREKRSLEQVKKVVCIFMQENIDDERKVIAIDIENKELYVDYEITQIDYEEPTCMLTDSEIEELLNIIKEYKIQEWDYEYVYEEYEHSLERYVWTVYLENEDNTVEEHWGLTDTFNSAGVKPPNYDEFKVAMEEFADRCISRDK